MANPILRAHPETGGACDDPSESLIIERTTDTTGQTYRVGRADQHFQTVAGDMRAGNVLLAAWAFEIDGWRDRADWPRLEL